MANNLNAIIPRILARSLMVLRGKLVMPRLVNGDYGSDARKKGSTVDVSIPAAQTVSDVTPSNAKPALVDKTPLNVSIPLDQWKQTSFHLTDKDMQLIESSETFLPMQVGSAIDALAETINGYLFGLYKEVPSWVGTAGTTPFATTTAAIIDARKKLHSQKAPPSDRRAVLSLDAEANALALAPYADVSQSSDSGIKIEGEIGRKYGFDHYTDQQVPTHTKGAGTAGTIAIDNSGGYSAGTDLTQTIHVDGLNAAFVAGDIFTIAGNTQQYTVVSAGALVSADQDITIQPALTGAVADDAALTVINTHVVNLAFHRDAFAFAMRPLVESSQDMAFGSKIMSMTDPDTGITLRLEVTRVHKAVTWEFDCLYGGKLIRWQLATRILG